MPSPYESGAACDDGPVNTEFGQLPSDLPVPADDGAADHLTGMPLPSIDLQSSLGRTENLAELSLDRLVAYVYPRTGTPGQALPEGWDDVPGARGCTPQSCAYRDSLAEFAGLGTTVIGISAQSPGEQREFADREHIPFALLSDTDLRLADILRLPTFTTSGMTLYKRLTLIAKAGEIVKAFYPVFPPDRDAAAVLAWLSGGGRN
jgi:peroxiredoxin